jgi:hypothetical protein
VALKKLDDDGGVVTTSKKGGSSGGGGSGGAGGSAAAGGGGPAPGGSGTTKAADKGPPTTNNKKTDEPKRADTTQPSNPELQRWIVGAIESERYTKAQIEAQIHKWHPTWTAALVERAYQLADRGPRSATSKPSAAHTMPQSAPSQATETRKHDEHGLLGKLVQDALRSNLVSKTLKHDVERDLHLGANYVKGFEHEIEKHPEVARLLAGVVAPGLQDPKPLIREIRKHPEDVAAALTVAAIFAPEVAVPLILLSIPLSGAAAVDAVRHGRYAEAVLDIASIGFSVDSLAARAGEKAALRSLRQEERAIEKAADEAATRPVGKPSGAGELSSAEEKSALAESLARLKASRLESLDKREVRDLADKIAAALALSAADRAKLVRALTPAH